MESLSDMIIGFGYVGVTLAVFAESGVFIGAFLPGDSLLFTLGLLASQGHFSIVLLWVLVVVAAILGDNVGYATGHYFGPKIFSKEDSLLFRKSHVLQAHHFYERHGKKALILARFVPVVRTFTPILAGVAGMHRGVFMLYNMIGGLLWGTLLLGLGYSVGRFIPGADAYLEAIIIAIIIISVLPIALEYLRAKRGNQESVTKTADLQSEEQ
jgi:membrane-associated protein